MTATLDAGAPAASECPPASATTTGGHSEAILVACALTGHALRFTGLPGTEFQGAVERIVKATLDGYSHAELLNWQGRTPPSEHAPRWTEARRLTLECYADLPGVTALPELFIPLAPMAACGWCGGSGTWYDDKDGKGWPCVQCQPVEADDDQRTPAPSA